jgi:hypothetical protein
MGLDFATFDGSVMTFSGKGNGATFNGTFATFNGKMF